MSRFNEGETKGRASIQSRIFTLQMQTSTQQPLCTRWPWRAIHAQARASDLAAPASGPLFMFNTGRGATFSFVFFAFRFLQHHAARFRVLVYVAPSAGETEIDLEISAD